MLNVPARMKTEKKLCVLAPEYLAKLFFFLKKTLIRSLNKSTLLTYEYSYLFNPQLFMPIYQLCQVGLYISLILKYLSVLFL